MNTYLIYGNDYSLIKKEINKITSGIKDIVKYDLSFNKIDELLDDASCISMFEDKKVLIGENALFLTSIKENINHNFDYLTKYIKDNNNHNIVILTVISDKIDERKKIVKDIKKYCKVIYKSLIQEKDMPNFVINEFKENNYKIDYKTSVYFVNYVGKNIDILSSEINKMIIYKENNYIITKDDINEISSRGLNDNVFDFTNAIMNKDLNKMYECLNDLLIIGEDPIKIISLLANQFLFIYQVKLLDQNGKNQNDIKEILKVHPYRIQLAMNTNFLVYELSDILKKLHELDFKIKTGSVDKKAGLEDFLLHI